MTTNNEDIIAAITEAKMDILERIDVMEELYWRIQSDVNDLLSLWHAENKYNKELRKN